MYAVVFHGGRAIETVNKSVGLWILFDGIKNSVFQSQVLSVVNQQLNNKVFDRVVIVSFENNLSAAQELLHTLQVHSGLEFILAKRPIFIGAFNLDSCVEVVSDQIFKIFPQKIIARGPIAGYIALKALCRVQDERQLLQPATLLPKLTIQARGLLAKEHELVSQHGSWNPLSMMANWFSGRRKLALETAVYSELNLSKLAFDTKIEAVSSYLADYLMEEFGVSQQRITLATEDLVPHLPANLIQQYREQSRNRLGLVESSLVYCYAGSTKSWQCCSETVDLFWELFENNPTIFFLVLTTEPAVFENLLRKKHIPADNYAVLSCSTQEEYYKLMCAADIGVVLRQDHVANWVSRPTKVLDYLACGLKLKHNNSVGWIIELGTQQAKTAAVKVASSVEQTATPVETVAKVTAAKRATKVVLKKTGDKAGKTAVKNKTVVTKASSKQVAAVQAIAAPSTAKSSKAKTTTTTASAKSKKTPRVAAKTTKKTVKQQASL